jgi:hypothetical protein
MASAVSAADGQPPAANDPPPPSGAQALPDPAVDREEADTDESLEETRRRARLTARLKSHEAKAQFGAGRPPPTFEPSPDDLFVPTKSKSLDWSCFYKHCDAPNYAYCRGCHKWFKHIGSGGTNTLHDHIAVCKCNFYDVRAALRASQAANKILRQLPARAAVGVESHGQAASSAPAQVQAGHPVQRTMDEFKVKKAPPEVVRALVDCIVGCDIPPSIVDKPAFKRLMHLCKYDVPGRTTIGRRIGDAFVDMEGRVKAAIASAAGVALTTDVATTAGALARAQVVFPDLLRCAAGTSVIAATAHWISPEWEMKSAVIGFEELDESHTSEYLSTSIVDMIRRSGVGRLVTCTTDNAANMLKLTRTMVENRTITEGVRCACHTLQLTVVAALELDCIKPLVKRAKELIDAGRNHQNIRDALVRAQHDEDGDIYELPPADPDFVDFEPVEAKVRRLLNDVITRCVISTSVKWSSLVHSQVVVNIPRFCATA